MLAIISTDDDLHARAVRHELEVLDAESIILDTSHFPARGRVTIHQDDQRWGATWTGADDVEHDLDDVRAVWWRRPQHFVLPDDLAAGEDWSFAYRECDAAIRGLWSSLAAAWVNDPDRDEFASRKVAQLRTAAAHGMPVPRTCITTDPDRARAFVAGEGGHVIYKPFGGTEQTWRETRLLRAEEHDLLDRVRPSPVIFQQVIDGGRDVRVTVVGDLVFAAEIRAADSDYPIDFRMDIDNAPITPLDLPGEVHLRVLDLVAHWRLEYAAIDLRIAPDGTFVFLEVNPAGQWLFVELATGQPISAALARHLVDLHDGRRFPRCHPPQRPPVPAFA